MIEGDFHKQNTLPGEESKTVFVEVSPIPEQIGEYKIEYLLEKGGMSLIFLGTTASYDPVTIKVLSPKYIGNEEVVQRFISEAEIIELADHPNIVKLYGHGKWEGGFYIAMEYIQGVNLRQYLHYRPPSLQKALSMVLEIAYALCHLHTHGVIHRDLKLENILVTEMGGIKVIDFGIAQILKDKIEEGPIRQRLIGTPTYMSPEQRENPESVSYPSDIYSLGIIAYELILGKLSFGQIHLGLMPKGLQKILAKTLQPKIQDRYQDVVDLITDISSYLNSQEWQKDQKEGRSLSVILESLTSEEIHLSSSLPPTWPHVELGIAAHRGMKLSPLYYDFFTLDKDTFACLIVEPCKKGIDGILQTAEFRGLFRSSCLFEKNPSKLINQLNQLLIQDAKDQAFTITYLILEPNNSRYFAYLLGYVHLWHLFPNTHSYEKISSENAALGVDKEPHFIEYSGKWQVGETLVLSSFSNFSETSKEEFNQEDFKDALLFYSSLSPNKQLESVLRKLKSRALKSFDEQSLVIISAKHT